METTDAMWCIHSAMWLVKTLSGLDQAITRLAPTHTMYTPHIHPLHFTYKVRFISSSDCESSQKNSNGALFFGRDTYSVQVGLIHYGCCWLVFLVHHGGLSVMCVFQCLWNQVALTLSHVVYFLQVTLEMFAGRLVQGQYRYYYTLRYKWYNYSIPPLSV